MLFLSLPALYAQDAQDESGKYPTLTSAIPGARFEIVQSSIIARETFKLDRVTGRVWQLAKNPKDVILWEETSVRSRPSIAPMATSVRFQIFLSGIAARYAFLIDSLTGNVWQLTRLTSEGEPDELAWIPM